MSPDSHVRKTLEVEDQHLRQRPHLDRFHCLRTDKANSRSSEDQQMRVGGSRFTVHSMPSIVSTSEASSCRLGDIANTFFLNARRKHTHTHTKLLQPAAVAPSNKRTKRQAEAEQSTGGQLEKKHHVFFNTLVQEHTTTRACERVLVCVSG